MTTMTDIEPVPSRIPSRAATDIPRTRIGEELPVFCERCGYSLNGLPQSRCDHCTILQFHCPECGHHQPINTLRPAFQRILGRARACALALIVFVKLNFFGWLLFAWFMVGVESSWERDWDGTRTVVVGGQVQRAEPRYVPVPMQLDYGFAFGLFGLGFGMVSRMLLLRWRRGYLVGIAIGLLVVGAVALGAQVNYALDRDDYPFSPFQRDFLLLMALAGATAWLGAAIVWGIWSVLVRVFLPTRIAQAVLDWQRFHIGPASALARD